MSDTPRTDALYSKLILLADGFKEGSETQHVMGAAAAMLDTLEHELAAKEVYAEQLLAVARKVAPYLTAKEPVDYVQDGDAWNNRANFLRAIKGAPDALAAPSVDLPALRKVWAADERSKAALCVACDGCGWCEGSPAFTCPDCKGTGLVDTYTAPVPPGYRHDDRCAYRVSVRNHCTCGYVDKEGA